MVHSPWFCNGSSSPHDTHNDNHHQAGSHHAPLLLSWSTPPGLVHPRIVSTDVNDLIDTTNLTVRVLGIAPHRSTSSAWKRRAGEIGGAPPEGSVAQPIGHAPTSVRVYSEGVDGRQPVLGREADVVAVVRVEKGSTALNVRLHAISAIALRGQGLPPS